MDLPAMERLKSPYRLKLISGERSLPFGLLVFAHLSCRFTRQYISIPMIRRPSVLRRKHNQSMTNGPINAHLTISNIKKQEALL